jgi:alkylation response protein AidB-like acyl-CoA dehydrogenase
LALLTEEQVMIRDAARAWTQEQSPVTAFRRMRDAGVGLGYEPAAYAEMCEMGWAGVVVPEALGGSELGCLTMGLILEETGRTLAASPLLASALAGATALVRGGSAAQKETYLPRIPSRTKVFSPVST